VSEGAGLRSDWLAFVAERWPSLARGGRACAPRELTHPSESGFDRASIAEACGQASDWVRALPDGSRLHAHEFPDGSIVVHRDEHDPGRGLVAAARHLFGETRVGRPLLAFGLAVAANVAAILLVQRVWRIG
jgi:hypothetical protein